jgi:hypothetical protein
VRVRLIILEVKILESKIEDIAHLRIEVHPRQRIWRSRELLARLVEMIEIEVRVAKGVHEFARRSARHLCNHHGEQCIGGDVERHAEKDVGRALVELAGKTSVRDIELEQAMARRQSHAVDLGGVPGADNQAA